MVRDGRPQVDAALGDEGDGRFEVFRHPRPAADNGQILEVEFLNGMSFTVFGPIPNWRIVPAGRTISKDCRMLSGAPADSMTMSAPRPSVSRRTSSTGFFSRAQIVSVAPNPFARSQLPGASGDGDDRAGAAVPGQLGVEETRDP